MDIKGLLGGGRKLAERFGDEAYYVALCIRSGLVAPELPHRIVIERREARQHEAPIASRRAAADVARIHPHHASAEAHRLTHAGEA